MDPQQVKNFIIPYVVVYLFYDFSIVVSTYERFPLQECPLPAVPITPDQQLALPCNIQIAHTLRIPVDEFDIRFEVKSKLSGPLV